MSGRERIWPGFKEDSGTPGAGGSSICCAQALKAREILVFPQPQYKAKKAVSLSAYLHPKF